MYYIWDRALYGSKDGFECKLKNFKGNDNFVHHKEENNVPIEGLIYDAFDCKLKPEDYPFSGTIFNFLASPKIVEILKAFDLNIQYFPSKIVRNDGIKFNDYQTLNILSVIFCADMDKSETKIIELSTKTITKLRRIVLDESKIPENEKLFWLGEKGSVLVVHQDIVDCIEKANITGTRFVTPEEYR